ncbi:Uncharacterised protein [Klebsiella pneumoniae]|nr:Uncharacterised protein [Klebsiella pneumoniae]
MPPENCAMYCGPAAIAGMRYIGTITTAMAR